MPEQIVNYPVPLCDCPAFSLPLQELTEMVPSRYDEESRDYMPQELRFLGEGPDGQSLLYSLVNGASLLNHPTSDKKLAMLKAWDEAYTAGKSSPDAALSERIGIPAVPYEGGWLLRVGKYYGNSPEYYYLSVVDPLSPAEAGDNA